MVFRTAVASLLALTTLILGCKAPIDTSKDQVPAWAVGGTLQDATLEQWSQGTEENRKATAGELVYELLWQGRLRSEDSARIFSDKVNRLVYALDQMAAEQASLSRFDAAIATRSVRYIVSEMTVGDRELVEIALGVTPVDEKGRPIK
jgi:hypothetical protein